MSFRGPQAHLNRGEKPPAETWPAFRPAGKLKHAPPFFMKFRGRNAHPNRVERHERTADLVHTRWGAAPGGTTRVRRDDYDCIGVTPTRKAACWKNCSGWRRCRLVPPWFNVSWAQAVSYSFSLPPCAGWACW